MARGLALFGGSFDPVHNGHVTMMTRLRHLDYDVCLMPAWSPPHKKATEAPYRHRFAMLRLVLGPGMRLSWLEKRLPSPSYTHVTLEKLSGFCPLPVLLVMGMDMMRSFDSWKNSGEIRENHGFLIFRRDGGPDPFTDDRDKVIPLDAPENSTEIRRLYGSGRVTDAEKFVPRAVHEYILRNRLYGCGGAHE